MSIRYWWFVLTRQKRRAGGMRAAQTRKANKSRFFQPPSQVPPQAGVIVADAGVSPEKAA